MRHQRGLTEQDMEKVRKLRAEGLDYDVIAERMGRPKALIKRIVKGYARPTRVLRWKREAEGA